MVWGWWGPGIQGLTSWSSCEIWICCGHWAHSPDPGLPGCGWRGILGPGAEHRHLLLQVLSDISLSASFLGQGGRLGQRGLFHLALGLRPQAGSLPGSQMVMKAHEGSPRGLWPPFLAPGGGELSLAFLDTGTNRAGSEPGLLLKTLPPHAAPENTVSTLSRGQERERGKRKTGRDTPPRGNSQ